MKITLLVLALALPGCGTSARFSAAVTGSQSTCVDGVEYIQFASGASVAYTTDGKVKVCK